MFKKRCLNIKMLPKLFHIKKSNHVKKATVAFQKKNYETQGVFFCSGILIYTSKKHNKRIFIVKLTQIKLIKFA